MNMHVFVKKLILLLLANSICVFSAYGMLPKDVHAGDKRKTETPAIDAEDVREKRRAFLARLTGQPPEAVPESEPAKRPAIQPAFPMVQADLHEASTAVDK